MTVPPSLSQPDPPTRLPGDPFPCIPILEGIRDGFALLAIVLDAQGNPADARFLEVNKAFERFTGLRRADVAGRLASDLGAPSP
ncbi:MAG TPA: PAS domain-containing protein, partial [Holophaga sp.]|nr:PAS domain-containing protein [Holophaga sp.]